MYNPKKTNNSNGVNLKNIQLSFIVLASLIILSFAFFVSAQNNSETKNNIFSDSDQDGLSDGEEKVYGTDPHNKDTDNDGYIDGVEVGSGYNPLKPAPGDKLISSVQKSETAATAENEENMTKKLAYQITQLTKTKTVENTPVNLGDIQSLVGTTLAESQALSMGIGGDDTTETLFTTKDIEIIKQDYDSLSAEKAKEKRKEDFVEYSAAVLYIFSSNSPQAITSGSSDFSSIINFMSQKIISSFTMRDPKQVEDISASGEKMLEQMKEVPVPEELSDMHIKALNFATYAKDMEKYIGPNATDPIADIRNLSKIGGLISNSSSLFSEMEAKATEYGLMNEPQLLNDKLKELQKNGVGA